MPFVEVDEKKYEVINGFSHQQYNSKKEGIHKYADKRNYSVLVGQEILIGKEVLDVEFKDLEITIKEENKKEINETTNAITSIEKYIPK